MLSAAVVAAVSPGVVEVIFWVVVVIDSSIVDGL